MQAGRKKPDRWRNMLKDAEQVSAAKAQQLAELQEVHEKLLRKKLVVDQIVDSFAFLKRIAESSASTMEGWSCFQEQLQSCLSQIAHAPQCSAVKPHAMDYMRVVSNPSWAATVRVMSDEEVLAHIRQAMGKCALMVLQDQSAAAWEQQQHPATSNSTSTGCYQQQQQVSQQWQVSQEETGRRCGHPVINQGLSAGQQGPFMSARPPQHTSAQVPAASGALACAPNGCSEPSNGFHTSSNGYHSSNTALPDNSAPAGSNCGNGTSSVTGLGRGPAFEVSVIWGVMFNTDEARFLRLISLDLETGEELKLQHGPGFGKWLGNKLRLSADQISVLKGLRDLLRQPHEVLPSIIQQAAVQQQQLTQHQEQQPQWSSNMRAAGQVYDAHEQVLQQQTAALDRFRLLAKFMGLVTLNTLSPGQLATLQACSWPAVSRIEPVLDVLDDLKPYTG